MTRVERAYRKNAEGPELGGAEAGRAAPYTSADAVSPSAISTEPASDNRPRRR